MVMNFVPYVLIGLVWIGVPVALFYFARRVLRALERRSLADSDMAVFNDRLHRLEERVEQIASDTERIEEGQRFASELLTRQETTAKPRLAPGDAPANTR